MKYLWVIRQKKKPDLVFETLTELSQHLGKGLYPSLAIEELIGSIEWVEQEKGRKLKLKKALHNIAHVCKFEAIERIPC